MMFRHRFITPKCPQAYTRRIAEIIKGNAFIQIIEKIIVTKEGAFIQNISLKEEIIQMLAEINHKSLVNT